jgi:hypothetical protein
MRGSAIDHAALFALFLGIASLAEAVTPPPAGTPARPGGSALVAERLPRVVYQGGPFLRRPRVVTVTFAGDDPAIVALLERFGETIADTPWWRESVAGYCAAEGDCIGSGRLGRAVRLEEKLPARIHGVDVAALLRREAAAGRFGPLDPDSVLLVYLPAGVTLFDAFHEHFCDGGPRAFHRSLRWDGGVNGYSVVARCGDEAATTATASHELVEIATNPNTQKRGFAIEPHSSYAGFVAAGVEPMDPCGILTRDTNWTLADGFAVQRAWSNRAAALGLDPCGGAAGEPSYVALVPRQPLVRLREIGERAEVVLDAIAGGSTATPGMLGMPGRPEIPGVPEPAGWEVWVVDLTGDQDGERYVDVAIDRTSVAAGDSVRLTVELRRRHPGDATVVGLLSTLGGRTHLWPLAVRMN